MRFALLGTHPDGLAFARALARSGRHTIEAVTSLPDESARDGIGSPRLVTDLADVLADPTLEAIIIATPLPARMATLRRVLQSERHVACVHPVDLTPDSAYEAALIRDDVKMVLLPLLPAVLHPDMRRQTGVKLIEMELSSREAVLVAEPGGKRAAVPGWEMLRRLGGEVAEVTAFTERAAVSLDAPLFVSGGFIDGGQFQLALRPHQPEPLRRLVVTTESGRTELAWPAEDWFALVEAFEKQVAKSGPPSLSWQDEVRCLELDDAVCRSVEKRRSVSLEYPDASEETGFKGTMTLLGCGLLWLFLALMIGSVWVPWLGWLVVPALAAFLLLQTLLWVARRRR